MSLAITMTIITLNKIQRYFMLILI